MNLRPLFLELLSAAIWNRPAEAALFDGVDSETWKALVRHAHVQRVSALIADGAASLPPGSAPPKAIAISLLLAAEKIEEANRSLNKSLADISHEYASRDFLFLLLKGQGNALYYPKPLHRTPGDLDLFLYREEDYRRAKKWVFEQGYPRESENMQHLAFDWGNAHIENHRYVTYFTNEKYNKHFGLLVKRIVDNGDFETVQIGETAIQVLPAEFNAFYVFEHLFGHFIHTGIGLRQVCDWLLILSARRSEIDEKRFTALAQQFGLLTAMQTLAHACIRYLGAKPEIFPFPLDMENRYRDLLMEDILRAGHFGFYRPEVKKTKGKWSGRWHRYMHSVKRTFVFGDLAPSHIRILPFTKLILRIKLSLKGG